MGTTPFDFARGSLGFTGRRVYLFVQSEFAYSILSLGCCLRVAMSLYTRKCVILHRRT